MDFYTRQLMYRMLRKPNSWLRQGSDPANFALVGLPPFDLLDDLAKALREKGLDIDLVFERAITCSSEFIYDPCRSGAYPAVVSSVNSKLAVGGVRDTHAQI